MEAGLPINCTSLNLENMKTKNFREFNDVVQSWWLMLCAGILFIALGIWIFISPVASYISLSLLFANGMMLAGLLEVTFSIVNHRGTPPILSPY